MAAIGTSKQKSDSGARRGATKRATAEQKSQSAARKRGASVQSTARERAASVQSTARKRAASGQTSSTRKRRTPVGAASAGAAGRGLDDSPRGRILRAAAHLFVTRGFGATTVRDLAAEVGILSGSLFHHFRNKGEILEAVMVEVIELNTARMRAAVEGARAPLEQVRALVRCELMSINGETSEAMSLLLQEWNSLDRAAQKRVLVLRDRYEALWTSALTAARKDLVAVPPPVLRRLIAGMNAHTTYWFRPGAPLTIEDLTASVMHTLVRKSGGR